MNDSSDNLFELVGLIINEVIPQRTSYKVERLDRDTSDKFRILVWFITVPLDITEAELLYLFNSRKVYDYPVIQAEVEGGSFNCLVFETAQTLTQAKVLADNYLGIVFDSKGNVV